MNTQQAIIWSNGDCDLWRKMTFFPLKMKEFVIFHWASIVLLTKPNFALGLKAISIWRCHLIGIRIITIKIWWPHHHLANEDLWVCLRILSWYWASPRSLDPGAAAIQDIHLKLILHSNIMKCCLPIAYFSVAQSFRNFAQSTAVSLLSTRFQNDWANGTDVMDELDFATFGCKLHLGMISDIRAHPSIWNKSHFSILWRV